MRALGFYRPGASDAPRYTARKWSDPALPSAARACQPLHHATRPNRGSVRAL